MNKAELVDSMAAKTGQNKKNMEVALEAFIQCVEDALKADDKITLVGFGSFESKKRKARKGINPQTKQAISIPASLAPVFKAGKALKNAVND